MGAPSNRSKNNSLSRAFWFVFCLIPLFLYITYSLLLLNDNLNNMNGQSWKQYRKVNVEHRYIINVFFKITYIII